MNGPTDFPTQQLHNILCTLSNNNMAVLQWVSGHNGIAGNETADRLAKAVAKLNSPHLLKRSQDPSETEAEISLGTEKQWIWSTERPD